MMPTRTDIRNQLKSLCQNLDGIATTSVFVGRRRGVAADTLPAICIYTQAESKETANTGYPRELDREMEVVFEIHIQANTPEEVETALDVWSAALEAAETLVEAGATIKRIVFAIDRMQGARENVEKAGFVFEYILNKDDMGI